MYINTCQWPWRQTSTLRQSRPPPPPPASCWSCTCRQRIIQSLLLCDNIWEDGKDPPAPLFLHKMIWNRYVLYNIFRARDLLWFEPLTWNALFELRTTPIASNSMFDIFLFYSMHFHSFFHSFNLQLLSECVRLSALPNLLEYTLELPAGGAAPAHASWSIAEGWGKAFLHVLVHMDTVAPVGRE